MCVIWAAQEIKLILPAQIFQFSQNNKEQIMNRILTTVLAISLSAVSLCEAEAQRRSFSGNGGNFRRGGMNRSFEMNEETAKEWASLQKELEKKDPKAFAEIKKLAATNLPAAYNKMQALARKNNLKMPRTAGTMRGRWGANRAGERGGMGRRGNFGGNRMNPAGKRTEAEAKIAEKFPAEYAAYKKSAESNMLKLKELAAKSGVKLPANSEEMAYVNKKYAKELEGLQWRERFAKLREVLEKEGYEMSFGGFGNFPGRGREPQMTRPAPPAKRDFSRNDLARKAKQQYPEEWQEYVELNKKDKRAARKKLEALLDKVR